MFCFFQGNTLASLTAPIAKREAEAEATAKAYSEAVDPRRHEAVAEALLSGPTGYKLHADGSRSQAAHVRQAEPVFFWVPLNALAYGKAAQILPA